ncbi:hypothetical protein LOZ51_003311 [Ophidiomyces ophidiicola]|nr:hypothetical protein LOZ55_005741 [Ophidiomyces ophidiicola]KAI1982699.1 hypothetical protein LOZ54_005297 [Ophidiomyces ophidiicola]KAI1995485.1 hypothetical protein LOZ51_003311 [Ophidiomyces ophidiicola]
MTQLPPAKAIPEYYQNLTNCPSLLKKIYNLDDSSGFRHCQYHLGDEEARNFVVDFDDRGAWCSVDVENDEISALLDKNTPKPFETRWIHIWAPERQVELVQTLTARYGMSHRLAGLMCSDPTKKKKITPVSPMLAREQSTDEDDSSGVTVLKDIETGQSLEEAPRSLEKLREFDLSGISFSQLVDKIWHFSTVDYGNEYICIGYNSLYVVPKLKFSQQPGRPDGKRVWSWLVLCSDGTVISIQENPFARETLSFEERREALKVIRRNIGLVLFGIPKQHSDKKKQNPLLGTHIRNSSNSCEDVRIRKGEAPSLLFYYIFDDWATNYSLVIGREHSYSAALEKLRTSMLTRPRIDLVTDLHRVGRELAVLKRLYQSYELIATRILNRQLHMMNRSRNGKHRSPCQIRGLNKHIFDPLPQDRWQEVSEGMGNEEAPDDFGLRHGIGGVQIKPAALNRIERLADRIRLYALSEIEECLNEKETLTFLVFNLIAIRDSSAVEKLTRSTVLLSKVTILFLPVSLLTSYFSTEIEGLKNSYTVKNYWVSFAVIMFLSIAGLSLFGWVNNAIGGISTYQSLKNRVIEIQRAIHRRRTRNRA